LCIPPGLKGYVANLKACRDGTRVTADRKRESIEAHLTIVFADLAVSRWIEHETG
jgi:hypothetical protein